MYWYGSRWYDDSLGRFIQPDPIVPGVGEGGNPNAVGYLGTLSYSPLIVDYHENQFLNQLNNENKLRLLDPSFKLSPVPANPYAFDRYSYSLDNPVKYKDPSGHCIWDLCIVEGITTVGVFGAAVVATAAVVVFNATGGPEVVSEGLEQAGEAASDALENAWNGLKTLFAKGEYIPSSLRGEAERNAYREAVHAYKDAFGLGAADDTEKWILDKIAELVKNGVKPVDIPFEVPAPEEDEMDEE